MNELLQKLSETAPEVWNQAVEKTILYGKIGVVFGVLLLCGSAAAAIKAYKLSEYDDEAMVLMYGLAVLAFLFGVIITVSAAMDLLYPLASAAQSLVSR